jgi:hypothetical protein
MAVGIRRTDPSSRKSLHQLRRQAAVGQSVKFAHGLNPRSFVIYIGINFAQYNSSPEYPIQLVPF